ncbi:FAD-dependent monooxygenase [Marinivivus vitaminiproducens]|uniref:FAD-dependent monooxygenase n=1 Tax=Marinivivus vitaminiproducens TaxID=3035935 RepID=UPI0027A1C6F7|nr:FAD-dependent monooxygenase [Geminicoccaceae bacterium SCSIO 64248]
MSAPAEGAAEVTDPRPAEDRIETAVVVVGGGIAGLAMTAMLGAAGHETVLVDRMPARGARDGRTTALLGPSSDILRRIGVWPQIEAAGAPLRRLALVNQRRGLVGGERVRFDAAEAGKACFGHNVVNDELRTILLQRIRALPSVRHLAGRSVRDGSFGPAAATLVLDDGRRIVAALAIAADGKDSSCRRLAGIGARSWRYGQTALVGAFRHERDHDDTSTEIHTPGGPLTVVPLKGRASSYVWVEREADARVFAGLRDDPFASALEARVGFLLGRVEGLIGRRMSYPLSGAIARRFHGPRLALIAEAAHSLHPIGAQGLNLSLRDVATLADLVSDAASREADMGSVRLLRDYETRRRPDVLARLYGTDALSRVTGSDWQALRLVRGLGFDILARAPGLRRTAMKAGLAPF